MPGFIIRLFRRFFAFLTRRVSYCFAIVAYSSAISGLLAIVFLLYALEAVQLEINPILLKTGLILFSLPWLTHSIQFGLFHKLGISGFPPRVARLNRNITATFEPGWKQELSTTELKQSLRDITFFPLTNSVTALIEVIVIWIVGIIVAYLTGSEMRVYFYITIGTILSAFIHAGFSFILSEWLTGPLRAKLKKELFARGSSFRLASYSRMRLKLYFMLGLMAIGLYVSITFTWYNPHKLQLIVSFALVTMLVLGFFTYLLFQLIYSSLKELEIASKDFIRGNKGYVYPRSLDTEWNNLADGLNQATRIIRSYQSDLEKKVEKRTSELQKANDKLQEKDKQMQLELNFAEDIQKGIIPIELPDWGRMRFATTYLPMHKVSGDYFDLFDYKDYCIIIMADASGHGVPAALITMIAKQAFSTVCDQYDQPVDILRTVNRILTERIETQDYLTATVLKINKDMTGIIANAAHPPAILFHPQKKKQNLEKLDTNGIFVGAMEDVGHFYEQKNFKLKRGDRLILYTDGIIEQQSPDGENFGEQRLVDTIIDTAKKPVDQFNPELLRRIFMHIEGNPIHDDISLFSIEVK